jgi:hypothetical protein
VQDDPDLPVDERPYFRIDRVLVRRLLKRLFDQRPDLLSTGVDLGEPQSVVQSLQEGNRLIPQIPAAW